MPPVTCNNLETILNYQFRRDNAAVIDQLEKTLKIDFKDAQKSTRVERSKLRHWQFDSEGFLRIIFPIAQEGWMKYFSIDGSLREEFVSAQTLWDSADSFKLKPIILQHPKLDDEGGRVTPRNAKRLQIGMTGNTAIIDNGILFLTGVITDQEGIASIVRGETGEVSCGYTATVVPYGAHWKQVDRVGNHVAAVKKARGGKELAFNIVPYMEGLTKGTVQNLDDENIWCATDAIDADVPGNISIPRSERVQVVIGRKAYQIDGADSEALATAIAELQVQADELPTVRGQLTEATRNLDTVQAKLDATETALTQQKADAVDPTKYVSLDEMSARITLWQQVSPFLETNDSNFKRDNSLSPVEIQRLFLSKRLPNIKLDGKSDDYVLSLYENRELYGVVDTTDTGDRVDSVLPEIWGSRSDAAIPQLDKSVEKSASNYKNAWKTKRVAGD